MERTHGQHLGPFTSQQPRGAAKASIESDSRCQYLQSTLFRNRYPFNCTPHYLLHGGITTFLLNLRERTEDLRAHENTRKKIKCVSTHTHQNTTIAHTNIKPIFSARSAFRERMHRRTCGSLTRQLHGTPLAAQHLRLNGG